MATYRTSVDLQGQVERRRRRGIALAVLAVVAVLFAFGVISMLLVALVLGLWSFQSFRKAAQLRLEIPRVDLSIHCSTPSGAAYHASSYGTVHTFVFENVFYATLFQSVNRAKLVH